MTKSNIFLAIFAVFAVTLAVSQDRTKEQPIETPKSLTVKYLYKQTDAVITHSEEPKVELNTPNKDWSELSIVSHIFPPFVYKNNGIVSGVLVDVAKAACNTAKLNCKIHLHALTEAVYDIESGRDDMLLSYLIDTTRPNAKKLELGVPLVKTSYSLYIPSYRDWVYFYPSDLNNRNYIVYGPSGTSHIAQKVLENSLNSTLSIASSNSTAVHRLLATISDPTLTLVINTEVAEYLLKTKIVEGIKNAGKIANAEFGVAYSLTPPRLDSVYKFKKALLEMKINGQTAEIIKSHKLEPV